MNLAQALAFLQPPPGHNTILNKEAIDVVCNAARRSPPAPAVAQDGVTDKREQIKAAVERMRAEDKMLMSMLTFDESCELAEAAIAPLLAENARLRAERDAALGDEGHDYLAERDRAEHDKNRLAEAVKAAITLASQVEIFVKSKEQINRPSGVAWFDGEVEKLCAALAEHDKLTSG